MPLPNSVLMEQLVERIKRLLAPDGAEVTWNEKIPDPNNPKQRRQIDVTIRRNDKVTHVECRLQSEVQNVGWIEELIGRRTSLRADAVIAVSASGFTEGAILKANAYGIILRNLATVSADEVKQWGKVTDARLSYYEFKDTIITFTLPSRQNRGALAITKRDGSPLMIRRLFELIMHEMEAHPGLKKDWGEVSCDFSGDIFVNGIAPTAGTFDTKIRKLVRPASLVSVVAYSAASSPTSETYARVQNYDQGFEIIDAENEVAVVVDLSSVPTPKNCLFYGAEFDFGRIVTLKWLEPIGLAEAMDFDGIIEIRTTFSSPQAQVVR